MPPRKMRNMEQSFLEELNSEVVKVNDVCSKAVLEIEDALRYLKRCAQNFFLAHSKEITKV